MPLEHPHPGDLTDLTLLSSGTGHRIAYLGTYTSPDGAEAQEPERAVLIVSRPALNAESAGDTMVAGGTGAAEIFRNSQYVRCCLS
jgi:hypothetical protein